MYEFFRCVKNVLRVLFIGFIAIGAIVKALDIKSEEKEIIEIDEADFETSEFDEIW